MRILVIEDDEILRDGLAAGLGLEGFEVDSVASCTDARAALFYQSIVSTFQRMGYNVIAEGVETEKEVALLKTWNVDLIQGYYFSRPLPAPMLLELLKEERGE